MGTSILKHVHLVECDSTQDVLKEQLNLHGTGQKLLVSCERQLRGRGRGSNQWQQLPGTICFSLNIEAHRVMSFTAMEISVLVALFFKERGAELRLKWPNDIWNGAGKKCGGILVQGYATQLLAGLGLNLSSNDPAFGGIFPEGSVPDKRGVIEALGQFIHENRFVDTERLRTKWEELCGHMGKSVTISEGGKHNSGIFRGLGDFGEALLDTSSGLCKLYNGSLRADEEAS